MLSEYYTLFLWDYHYHLQDRTGKKRLFCMTGCKAGRRVRLPYFMPNCIFSRIVFPCRIARFCRGLWPRGCFCQGACIGAGCPRCSTVGGVPALIAWTAYHSALLLSTGFFNRLQFVYKSNTCSIFCLRWCRPSTGEGRLTF